MTQGFLKFDTATQGLLHIDRAIQSFLNSTGRPFLIIDMRHGYPHPPPCQFKAKTPSHVTTVSILPDLSLRPPCCMSNLKRRARRLNSCSFILAPHIPYPSGYFKFKSSSCLYYFEIVFERCSPLIQQSSQEVLNNSTHKNRFPRCFAYIEFNRNYILEMAMLRGGITDRSPYPWDALNTRKRAPWVPYVIGTLGNDTRGV